MATQSRCGQINKQAIKRMSSYLLEGEGKGKRKEKEKKKKEPVSLVPELCQRHFTLNVRLLLRESRKCHITASCCPPIEQSDCNMTSSHIIFPGVVLSPEEIINFNLEIPPYSHFEG